MFEPWEYLEEAAREARMEERAGGEAVEAALMAEIERLRGALEAVTTFHQVTHCHAAARAGLAGIPVGEKPSPTAPTPADSERK